jgi:serine/threonine-protein kinase
MDTERWQRLSPLLDTLFELDVDERVERLRALREADPALADEVESLMALEQDRADFMAEPLVAPMLGARAGGEIGPYRLESMLGEGGMGQVWLAARADGLYQRRVALKLLRPGLTDTNLRLRFTRERQILARLAHPHIARLLDAGVSSDGLPYLALEYVEGEPITDYCRNHRTPLEARLRMFQQICDAVSHAHANLIVHRDLKPSNILVTPGGDIRLLDFGIAKLLDSDAPVVEQTRTGVRTFTLHYAAPEQIRGEPVTTMTDVYALGVVLYELLTDTKPYKLKRQTDAEWEEAILAADPQRPSQTVLRHAEDAEADAPLLRRRARQLAGDLDNIVLKTLSKRPEQRYPSVEALALDLERYESGRPVQARPQSLGYRFNKYVHRHRWALATGSTVALVLSLALLIVAWQARQAVAEASRAQAMQDFMVGLFASAGGSVEGQALDLRGLLDAAVERGNRELARQPRARAELFGVIARGRIGLGDYREAKTLLDRQATIIASTGSIPLSLLLESLTLRGQVLGQLGDARECIDLMQPHLAAARREQAQLPSQSSGFYSQLGRCRRANGERQGARQLFERSLALRQEIGDTVGEVENRMDLAGLQVDVGATALAMGQYRDALGQLRRAAGDRHPLLIPLHRNLAKLQRSMGQPLAAERDLVGALAIALDLNGAQHPVTLQVRRELAAARVDQGHFADAARELREVHRRLIERHGPGHESLAESNHELGLVEWELGQVDAAFASLSRAAMLYRRGGRDEPLAKARFDQAQVLHALGRDAEARPLLQESRKLRELRFGAQHPAVGDTDRLLGEVLVALGEHPAGMGHLANAVRLTRNGYGDAHANTRRAELALARQQARDGDEAALDKLDSMAALAPDDPALRQVSWLAGGYAAQLRCHGAQHERAARTLNNLRGRLRQMQPDGSALAREIAALSNDCQAEQVARR